MTTTSKKRSRARRAPVPKANVTYPTNHGTEEPKPRLHYVRPITTKGPGVIHVHSLRYPHRTICGIGVLAHWIDVDLPATCGKCGEIVLVAELLAQNAISRIQDNQS